MTVSGLAGRRVLIVDDDAIVAALLSEILIEYGAEPAGICASVDAALSGVARGGFDVALLDIRLAGRQSWPVADALRARGIPALLITGYGREALPATHRHMPLLEKPFRPSELSRALLEVLELVAA